MHFDVVVVGGGTSGSAAGIQAARLGVKTLIIEETPWLGGMITAAGVSAFDGNKYALGGGIFGELRKKIEDYYGGPDKTYTGWISLTCFEPKKGKEFLHELAENEKDLTVWYETKFIKVITEGKKVKSVVVKTKSDEEITVDCNVVIEATEYGDVIASAGLPYRLGRDTKADTGEADAPEVKDDLIQDMTFCAILKKYDGEAPKVQAVDYDPEEFVNSTAVHANATEKEAGHILHSWESFISYAALPNNKYLLNWPFRSNDYFPTPVELYENPETREYHFKKAKEHTMKYLHYMQNTMKHPEWGLATDEFPTEDNLPFIPYVRESRRLKGEYLMVESDVLPKENSFRPPLRSSGIAVGDYFLDHHHASFFLGEVKLIEPLPDNAPFQIPMESLYTKELEGFVAAEKSISVTHIVNGCSRLQPVVMLIGQAAGAIAALSVKRGYKVHELSVEEVQEVLLDAGCQLFPYKDIWNTHPYFKEIQYLAINGLYVDESDFEFKPEKTVDEVEEKAVNDYLLERRYPEIQINGLKREDAYFKIYNHVKF